MTLYNSFPFPQRISKSTSASKLLLVEQLIYEAISTSAAVLLLLATTNLMIFFTRCKYEEKWIKHA